MPGAKQSAAKAPKPKGPASKPAAAKDKSSSKGAQPARLDWQQYAGSTKHSKADTAKKAQLTDPDLASWQYADCQTNTSLSGYIHPEHDSYIASAACYTGSAACSLLHYICNMHPQQCSLASAACIVVTGASHLQHVFSSLLGWTSGVCRGHVRQFMSHSITKHSVAEELGKVFSQGKNTHNCNSYPGKRSQPKLSMMAGGPSPGTKYFSTD